MTRKPHPTCRAVLKLLEEATQLLRERINEAKPTPEIQAMAIGYCFSSMQDLQGPFSHVRARELVQRAYIAGWQGREDFQGKIDGKESQANVVAAARPYPEKIADPNPSVAKRGRFQKSSKRRADLRRDARVG